MEWQRLVDDLDAADLARREAAEDGLRAEFFADRSYRPGTAALAELLVRRLQAGPRDAHRVVRLVQECACRFFPDAAAGASIDREATWERVRSMGVLFDSRTTLVDLLGHAEPGCRQWAALALSRIRSANVDAFTRVKVVDPLLVRQAGEADPAVRTALVWAAGRLMDRAPYDPDPELASRWQTLATIARQDPSVAARALAAGFLLYESAWSASRLAGAVVDALAAVPHELAVVAVEISPTPWLLAALRRCGPRLDTDVVPRLANALRRRNRNPAGLTEALLALTFFGRRLPPRATAGHLSTAQRLGLSAIADAANPWPSASLRALRLPARDPDQLRRWLQRQTQAQPNAAYPFADLYRTRWGRFSDVYSRAYDLPELIRDLAASDRTTRAEACDELWSRLVHQGNHRPSAGAAAAPHLIGLLARPDTVDKDRILQLLLNIAVPGVVWGWHQPPPFRASRIQGVESAQWRRNHTAVRAGLSVYRDLLKDPRARTQRAATEVLTWLE